VAEADGVPAGTTVTCVFGPVAWVAMVLVDEAQRRRGIGSALVRHALAYLDGRGVRTVRLDATPLGQPVYERLGFVASYRLARYAGVPPAGRLVGPLSRLARPHLPGVIELDRAVTGADRGRFLPRLLREWPWPARVADEGGRIEGYVAARRGAHAVQVGPCIGWPRAAALLLEDACRRVGERGVYVDIPTENRPAAALAERLGLTAQRHLLRMTRGEPVRERVEDIWASSGPEKG
jgi:GNAT superfamily N-acetyltransferase